MSAECTLDVMLIVPSSLRSRSSSGHLASRMAPDGARQSEAPRLSECLSETLSEREAEAPRLSE